MGVAFPGPGRRADAGDAIVVTLAVLVFSTGAAMTFSEMSAIRTAGRRLAVVLPVTTVGLPVLAWLASRLVSGVALRGGILSAGLAPTEVASVALTGLAGGDAVLAAGLLATSTVLTVLLAGPILGIAGAHSVASPLGLLATLALVVALPLVAGSALRSVDPFRGRERPAVRVLGTASLLVLLWEVASQLHLQASDAPRPAGPARLPRRGRDPGRCCWRSARRRLGAPPSCWPRRCGTSPWPRASRPARSGPRPRPRWASTGCWC